MAYDFSQITTSADAHKALSDFFVQFPLVYRTAGQQPATAPGFYPYSDHADFPDLFPLINEGPLVFLGRVWRAAPAGYDPTQPTVFGERHLDLASLYLAAQLDYLYDSLRALGK